MPFYFDPIRAASLEKLEQVSGSAGQLGYVASAGRDAGPYVHDGSRWRPIPAEGAASMAGLSIEQLQEMVSSLSDANIALRSENDLLRRSLAEENTYISKRYEQARAQIQALRGLADTYERLLDGPPKD